MRIENSSRSSAVSGRAGVTRSSGQGGFFVDLEPAPTRAEAAQGPAATASIDSLLALQAADDPLNARRKAVRRGRSLLDTLDEIKADLLVGRVSEGRLNQLMALIGSARQRGIPGLDGVLDDIELRARVELAKFGRFPA